MKFEIIKKYGGRIVITNGKTELAPGNGFSTFTDARKAFNLLKKYNVCA